MHSVISKVVRVPERASVAGAVIALAIAASA